MKGTGRVTGWSVKRRGANDIEWEQTRGKRWVAVSRAGLGDGKIGYEMMTKPVMTKPGFKSRVFKGAGSLNRALAAAKRYMVAHPRN